MYEASKVGIKFTFEHPEYISVGKPDTMKIKFANADTFFQPENSSLQPLPNGYTLVQKIPPQGKNLLSQEEVAQAKESGQAFVIGNLLISLLFKATLQLLLGSIIVV